jgi:hypothetical protein
MKTNTLNAIIALTALSAIAVTGMTVAAANGFDLAAITVSFSAVAGIAALALADYRGNRRDYGTR